MVVAGIDIGSLATKIVILDNSHILYNNVTTIAEQAEVAARMVLDKALDALGLGREDVGYTASTGEKIEKATPFINRQVSSIRCLAKGARWLFPSVRTVIDVGAESSNVVSLNERGQIVDWAINDKCAAGAGAFLEAMAKLMQMPLEEMAEKALAAERSAIISSTCTIFAEQEVISYSFDASPPSVNELLAGLHEALATRISGLAKMARVTPAVVLTGGVAKNIAFSKSLERKIGIGLIIPEEPRTVAALGAALIAKEALPQ